MTTLMTMNDIKKDAKDLTKFNKSIATRGKKLEKDLHVSVVSGLWHLNNLNTAPLVETYKAMRQSQRKEKFAAYVHALGGYIFTTKKDKKTGDETVTLKKDKEVIVPEDNIEQAIDLPFWEMELAVSEDVPYEVQLERVQQTVKNALVKALLLDADFEVTHDMLEDAKTEALKRLEKQVK